MSQTTSSSGANKRPYRKYDTAFRKSVVEQMQNGRPVAEIAEAYGVSKALLYRWRSQYGQVSPEEQAETAALRKCILELEQDNAILKKALSIFSQSG